MKNTATEQMTMVPVIGRTAEGKTVWYTGRAGSDFISTNPREAFQYQTADGARNRARMLNNGTPMHGIYFVACVGEAAELVRTEAAA